MLKIISSFLLIFGFSIGAASAEIVRLERPAKDTSFSAKQNPESARLAFDKEKTALRSEYNRKMEALGDSQEDQTKRKQLLHEYRDKLKVRQKDFKQELGIKDKKISAPPAVYSATERNYYSSPARKPNYKSFQKPPAKICPFRRRCR